MADMIFCKIKYLLFYFVDKKQKERNADIEIGFIELILENDGAPTVFYSDPDAYR